MTHFHHDNGFLDYIANPCRDKLQQYIDTAFCCRLDLDSSLTDCPYAFPNKIYIYFGGIPKSRLAMLLCFYWILTLSIRSVKHRHCSPPLSEP